VASSVKFDNGFWKADPDFIFVVHWQFWSISNRLEVIKPFRFGWDSRTRVQFLGFLGWMTPRKLRYRKTLGQWHFLGPRRIFWRIVHSNRTSYHKITSRPQTLITCATQRHLANDASITFKSVEIFATVNNWIFYSGKTTPKTWKDWKTQIKIILSVLKLRLLSHSE